MLILTEKQIDAFWSKVQKTDTCWLWTAGVCNGYGRFLQMGAHVVALELEGISVDPPFQGLHKCDVKRCVRVHPDHVYLGTAFDNARDKKVLPIGRLIKKWCTSGLSRLYNSSSDKRQQQGETIMKFEEIDRPKGRAGIGDPLVEAIAETVETKKAIKISMEGVHLINFQSTMRNRLKKLDPPLRLRYNHDKPAKALILWAEPMDAAEEDFDVSEATNGVAPAR